MIAFEVCNFLELAGLLAKIVSSLQPNHHFKLNLSKSTVHSLEQFHQKKVCKGRCSEMQLRDCSMYDCQFKTEKLFPKLKFAKRTKKDKEGRAASFPPH